MKILKLLNSFIFFLFCCVCLLPRFFESADLQFNQFDDYLDEDFEVDTVGTVYRTSNSKTLEKSSFNDIQETVNEIEDEGDYDEEEDIVINSGVFTPPARISVMFENAYTNESVDLYWVSDKGEEVYMSEIFPTESARVDTTVSHAFLAKGKISGALMNPSLVRIQICFSQNDLFTNTSIVCHPEKQTHLHFRTTPIHFFLRWYEACSKAICRITQSRINIMQCKVSFSCPNSYRCLV